MGETARSLGERVEEHFREFRGRKCGSVLYQHAVEKHNGNLDRLDISILSRNRGDPTKRQLHEAVIISETEPQLNSKYEL